MEAPSDRPLFPPDSVTWRVNQEPALLLAGGRALLMQLAHPGVAAGVDEHSDYRRRPLRRLARTLRLTMAISFGTREQALAAARRINDTHRRVRGEGYEAMDPRLLLWVHATLIDSAVVAYRTFVGPLTPAEEEAYYRQATVVGALLGIPRGRYPSGLAGFRRYLADMLEGDELRVDERARALAGYVLRPRLRLVPGFAYWPVEVLTAGLLP
ncbi:MAG TPA: oxygenase MpaB family protein, partial [Candidatus Dormibacteraeota bacterium]|nr:oxygenase MpaB family protein [Candidatus Dormibacteraeota bacterium]